MEKTNLDSFLKFTFQMKMEENSYFFDLPSPETNPFDNKYIARKILEDLLKNEIITNFPEVQEVIICTAIIHYKLAVNFLDTEENSFAEKSFKESMKFFSKVDESKIVNYFNYLQEIYNNLGFICLNHDDNIKGIGMLAKSEELYEIICEVNLE